MRRATVLLMVASLAGNVAGLGAWWWTGGARAEKSAGASAARVAPDLFARSRGFRELLAAVEQRGHDLDRREDAVAAREAALNAIAATLGEQVEKLEPAEEGGGDHGRPCAATVSKVYETMKPEDAAPIIDRLDDATATSIFTCMRERQIAAILALMSHDRAVALTKALAKSS
jgi:flagellar motility protein MotE (MotC chaperone)